ncbi:6335_t:CDS:1, partial [Cetraspora pellucida]
LFNSTLQENIYNFDINEDSNDSDFDYNESNYSDCYKDWDNKNLN